MISTLRNGMIMLFFAVSLSVGLAASPVGENRFDINVSKKGAPIQPTMYGLFFEDINYAADGGLYAELVKNRSFEFPGNNLQGWKAAGTILNFITICFV